MEYLTISVSILITILFLYILYHIPIVISGLLSKSSYKYLTPLKYPMVSIIVPARDEERVIGRCLDSLINQDYPRDKYEIIIVDGASRDGTRDIYMSYFHKYPDLIKVVRESSPRGKPDALNKALEYAQGEIIAVFDADSILPKDTLSKAVYFLEANPDVAAIQGRISSVNAMQNILTRLIHVEETGWFRLGMRGRDRLNLFIPFMGNCLFIRSDVLKALDGWRSGDLAEDMDLSIRLLKHGYKVRYVDEISILQEAPSKLSSFISQRYRWYRGYINNMVRYGELIKNVSIKYLDAEILLIGPIVMSLSLLSYFILTVLNVVGLISPVLNIFLWILNGLLILTVFTVSLALKSRGYREALTGVAIIIHWILESVIAFKAVLDTMLRKRAIWVKTIKEGFV